MKKILFISILVIMLLMSLYNVTYATEKAKTIDGIISGADNFMEAGQSTGHMGISKAGIYEASDLIYNTLLIIGIVVVIIVGAILGIKYMTASVEGQAKIKETLVPFIVGTVIIFGAFGIWKLVTSMLENLG